MAYIQDIQTGVQIQPNATNMDTFVYLSQNENGRKIYFKILGIDELPENSTATLEGTKPDGTAYSATGAIDDITIVFEEDDDMTAVAGTWDAKIKIENGEQVVATDKIRFVIDPDTVTS